MNTLNQGHWFREPERWNEIIPKRGMNLQEEAQEAETRGVVRESCLSAHQVELHAASMTTRELFENQVSRRN